MKLALRLAVTAATLSSALLLGLLPSACGSEGDSGTSGKRIVLDAKITSSDAKAPFTNAMGWSVSLTKAVVATGALYYYDGATIFSQNTPPPRGPLERLNDAFGIRTAFAHPGHYIPGNAKGQILVASSGSLLAEDPLGVGDGVSGIVRSATFSFQAPAQGPLAGELGTHVAVLEGTATKGADTRPFRAEIEPADILNTKNATQVEGCPFAEVDMEADGVVTVNIKVAQWFDQVEFDTVPASADGKPVLIPDTVIARNELVRGMKEGLAYNFSYAPK